MSAFAETDFGIHPKIRKVRTVSINYKLTESQRDYIKELGLEDDYILKIKDEIEYDDWLMTKYKNKVWDLSNELVENIVRAVNTKINSYESYCDKRRYQNAALDVCFLLFACLQQLLCTFDFINANRIDRYVGKINSEITYIQKWMDKVAKKYS